MGYFAASFPQKLWSNSKSNGLRIKQIPNTRNLVFGNFEPEPAKNAALSSFRRFRLPNN